jgi:hypothetical protein
LDEGIVLLKTQSLKNLSDIGDKSTAEIVAEVAASSSIYSILPQDSFKRFLWSELSQVKYSTVSYMSSTKWSTLLEFMFGINGVQSEFMFVDAFCLGGAKKDLDKAALLAAIKKLFEKSSEHHIFEPGSIINGWTWHDLSLLSPFVRPTLHSSTDDAPLIEMLIDSIKADGFDFSEFSNPEDRDTVRSSIIERWTTVERLNERVLDTVGTSLYLAQVHSLTHSLHKCVLSAYSYARASVSILQYYHCILTCQPVS